MRKEYDFEKMTPIRNPFAKALKQQVTININITSVNYFKEMAAETGVPYQTLINIYLDQCAKEHKRLVFIDQKK